VGHAQDRRIRRDRGTRIAAEQRTLAAIRDGVTTLEYYNLPTEFDEAETSA
jgi:hypothetical protein